MELIPDWQKKKKKISYIQKARYNSNFPETNGIHESQTKKQ